MGIFGWSGVRGDQPRARRGWCDRTATGFQPGLTSIYTHRGGRSAITAHRDGRGSSRPAGRKECWSAAELTFLLRSHIPETLRTFVSWPLPCRSHLEWAIRCQPLLAPDAPGPRLPASRADAPCSAPASVAISSVRPASARQGRRRRPAGPGRHRRADCAR